MRRLHGSAVRLLVGVALVCVGCGDVSSPAKERLNTSSSLSVSPKLATVDALGATAELTAAVSGGGALAQQVTWTSLDPSLASVSSTGRVTAHRTGETRVVAATASATDTAVVRVTQTVASVVVRRVGATGEATDSLVGNFDALGDTLRMEAVALDRNGHVIPGVQPSWSSLTPAIVPVTADGLTYSLANGDATIVARVSLKEGQGREGQGKVKVNQSAVQLAVKPDAHQFNALFDTLQLTVEGVDRNGANLKNATLTWTSLSPNVATVDGKGRVKSAGNGTARIVAISGSQADTTFVTVQQAIKTVSVFPQSVALIVGQGVTLVAGASDALGSLVPGVGAAWASNAPEIVRVEPTGRITAVGIGSATVTATIQGMSTTTEVTVAPIPVASVAVTPSSAALHVGQTAALTATTKDAAGNVLAGRAITWSSGKPDVATVSATGVVTAVSPGSAAITAMSEGKTGSATITVTQTPVASVVVTPSSSALAIGADLVLTAATLDANGNQLIGRSVTWSTSASAVAKVDAAGKVTAVAAGSAIITATSEGRTGTAQIAVPSSATQLCTSVARVVVSPRGDTLNAIGATRQFAATAYDAAGNTVTGVNMTWGSLKTSVATISSAGLATAKGVGSALIVATAGGCAKADTVGVVVRQIVSSVQLIAPSSVLAAGTSVQFQAASLDANGNPISGQSVSWSSSAPSVATVDASGRVTALEGGTAVIRASAAAATAVAEVVVSFVPPDLASSNFISGSLAPFVTAFQDYVFVGNDPTGTLSTKVAHIRYHRTSTTESPDVNQAIWFNHAAGIGLGQSVFLKGDVVIPTPASNMRAAMRKLIYVMRNPNDVSFAVVKAEGTTLKAEITGHRVFAGGSIPFDTKATLEVQITVNTALGKPDGVFRLWKDGVLVAEATDVIWLTSSAPFTVFAFGHQTQHERNDTSVLFSEVRYWDRLGISTKRIGH